MVTETPFVTPDPEVTETLVVTPDPVVTETTVVTPDLEVTETLVVTPDSVVTETPVIIPDPVVDETPVITFEPENTPRWLIGDGYYPFRMIEISDISIHGAIIGENFIKRLEDESGLIIGKILPEELMWHNTLGSSGGLTAHSASIGGGEQAAISIAPEPVTLSLLAIGAMVLLRRRRF